MHVPHIAGRRGYLAGLLLAAFIATGCGGSADEPSAQRASGGEERPRIALIMKSLANEFFVTMAEGAEAHHAAHGDAYDLIVNGIRNESDLGQQVALVEQMMATGVDALVIAPADSRALVPVLKRAMDRGIVVVNIDNRLDEATLEEAGIDIPFVGPDNREGARMVGTVAADRLQSGDEVAILEGIPTAFNAQQRLQGFQDAMDAAGIEVVDVQSGEWEQAKANTVASAMINAHPGLDAILASNDNMALGAAAAVRQAGKTGEILIVGFDNIDAIRQMVRDGRVLATADQHGDRLAVYGIEFALEVLEDGTVPYDRQTPVEVVTAESL